MIKNTTRPILPKGGTIAIIAPSSAGDVGALASGVERLKTSGYNIIMHPQTGATDYQAAGTAPVRSQAFMDVMCDPAIDAVIATRGGNRAMQTLTRIDWARIKSNPKPILGFSDITALLCGTLAQAGFATFHGPTLSRIGRADAATYDQMIACLSGTDTNLPLTQATILQSGVASGPLVVGNLSLITALIGTPYLPDLEGAILCLEDVGDEMSRYDRMILQLRLSGILHRLSGLVFGPLDYNTDTSAIPFGLPLPDMIAEHTHDLGIPVIMGAPFGHTGPLYTLPLGVEAELKAMSNSCTLNIGAT